MAAALNPASPDSARCACRGRPMGELVPIGDAAAALAEALVQARDEIVRLGGTQFDPLAVATFLSEETVLRQMVALKCVTAGPGPLRAEEFTT